MVGFCRMLARVGLCLCTAVVARAGTYYVDVDWAGVESGASNAPFNTIGEAVATANAVSGSHTIYIAGGAYADVAQGGLEDFSAGGGVGGGIDMTRAISFYGGYAGWDGASGFDWSAGTRVPRSSVIDLTGADSRALYRGQISSLGTPVIDGLTFCHADHTSSGGALATAAGSFNSGYALNNCLFTSNRTTGVGGAVDLRVEALSRITNCDFIDNEGSDGGAVYWLMNYQMAYEITNCLFRNNLATNVAGAVFISTAYNKWVRGCRFEGNQAAVRGGALFGTGGITTVDRSVFVSNACPDGAAIGGDTHHVGSYTLVNSLFHDNTGGYAVKMAGANVSGGYTIDMLHCTVADNPVGGVWSRHHVGTTGVLRMRNSIIANNGGYGVYRAELNDPEPILEYNNVFGNAVGDYYQASAGAGSISADPKFAPQMDYRLRVGSPCRNAATNAGSVIDLDGNARPFDFKDTGFDMGCYEMEPPPKGTLIMVR